MINCATDRNRIKAATSISDKRVTDNDYSLSFVRDYTCAQVVAGFASNVYAGDWSSSVIPDWLHSL